MAVAEEEPGDLNDDSKDSDNSLMLKNAMSRNGRTRSQLLSVYYKIAPRHARGLNVLSTMGINSYRPSSGFSIISLSRLMCVI